METGIAPRARAIQALDKIRNENVGAYGPFLSAVERQAMMTISTGVQAVSEGNYGRTDEALWYVDKIVQTFNRKSPGSITEMMPDYGCFTIAWTSYGIELPLIQHVFGIQPDAINKTVVFDPHVPTGWEDMSIENLAIGTNIVAFSRAKTGRGTEYAIAIDADYDNQITPNPYGNNNGAGASPLRQGVIAWSLGKDLTLGKGGSYTNSDDVISWQ